MRKAAFISLLILVSCASTSLAQVNKGNLSGVVKDSSGATVADAVVRLVNTETSVPREEKTDGSGLYRFILVDLGVYRIEAERAGFKKAIQDGIHVDAGQTTTADITMEVGQISDSVTIQGAASLLQTESASNGGTVTTKAIVELPLQGRNPYVFLSLAPGIQYTGDPGALNPWDVSGPSTFASSGSKSRAEFLLDGVPNMRIDAVSFSPSPDAVGEMRTQTNAFDAEYGHSGASFINVSTKSGTNSLHGGVYWYVQNNAFNANTFFNNLNGVKRGYVNQNTFGANLGGPVVLPKLYNGRNKTFYFFNYEGTRKPSFGSTTLTVPTAQERTGDFSHTTDANGKAILIYDPFSTIASGSGYIRTQFPGNIIPASRMNALGVKLLADIYPLPNATPAPGTLNNYIEARHTNLTWNSMATRVDENLNSTNTLFFRFGWNHRTDNSNNFFPDNKLIDSGADVFGRQNFAGGIGETWIYSPRTVIDFRFGLTRYNDLNQINSEGIDLTTVGFPASFAHSLIYSEFPTFNFTNTFSTGTQQPNRTAITVFNPMINVHSVFGRHAVKYGFRYTVEQNNQFLPLHSAGVFNFGRTFTQGPDPTKSSSNSGDSTAELLLGTPDSGSVDVNAYPAYTTKYFSFYGQDDWKISDRLTLNLGLRIEHEGPTTDRFNNGITGFIPSVASPLQAAVQTNYAKSPIPQLASINVPGGLGFLATGGAGRGDFQLPAIMWAPRFGYAYRVTDKIVWRGGWGIYYVPNNITNFTQTGFSLTTQMVTSLDGNLTPFNLISNPFPNGLSQPAGAKNGLLTAVGQSISASFTQPGAAPHLVDGLSQQFSMGFQFALPKNVSLEVSYVGNNSQRLTISRTANDIPNAYLALGNGLNTKVANPFFGVVTDPTSALSQSTTTVQQLLRPYPQFTGLTQLSLPTGRSTYNSLQVQVFKRLANGLQVGGAYTFSKYLEAISYLNSNDARPINDISDSDRTHHLVINGLWEMPVGPGKRYLTHGLTGRVLGGWQVSWIGTFQSGPPLAFSGAIETSNTLNNPQTIYKWFDTSAFAPLPPFTLNSLPPRLAYLRGPGIDKTDISLVKRFYITERMKAQIQADFYNAPNIANFNPPNTTVTSTTFGQITGVLLQPRNIQLTARISF